MLRAEWQRLHGVDPPPDLTRDLLLRGVAHRLQERALGGLSPAAQWQLERLAPLERTRRPGAVQTRLRPGMTLARSWRGQTHTIVVREAGFEFAGRVYRSLSIIAREITGAHWSGPRFFGLTDAGKRQREARDG